MGFTPIICVILALCLFSYQHAAVVKVTNLVCKSHNESWILVNQCRLRAINRYRTIVNFNATLLHPVNVSSWDGRLLKKENGYKPWLYKLTIDTCKFLKKPYNPIAIIMYKILRTYSNLNHTCPYVGPLIVKDFYMLYENFKVPLPSGEFLLEMDWFFDQKKQLTTNLYWIIDETANGKKGLGIN